VLRLLARFPLTSFGEEDAPDFSEYVDEATEQAETLLVETNSLKKDLEKLKPQLFPAL